jgi:hypothetical protein
MSTSAFGAVSLCGIASDLQDDVVAGALAGIGSSMPPLRWLWNIPW